MYFIYSYIILQLKLCIPKNVFCETIEKAYTFREDENIIPLCSLFWGELPIEIRKPKPGFNGSIIPSWYFRQHRKGNLPPRSINIITIHSAFLTPQMENQKLPASSYQ